MKASILLGLIGGIVGTYLVIAGLLALVQMLAGAVRLMGVAL